MRTLRILGFRIGENIQVPGIANIITYNN